ncbi:MULTISPECIES: aminodeoxychorismate/anthranilate synthase component II [Thermodesulfobacterium]|jgi:anthranilate synthase component 2|uniref:anthranilate synthase component II n=1 Tax=Thermodesulfobacterium TaxID=1740 RepID=UPI00040CE094|nr:MULTISPECIES: aminodeoxychorismate/anthranilate synthase component II [Thermodesulfobacterium]HCE80069.1 aminodeoxychorismate/anthranilate synthase component II [Thermodesulfobacterium commune]MBZ4681595.1 anthranilate synthase component [Thermodesulfobacterium sp.]MDK2860798.1 anthranilate synthase component [Thermodesulfobacterium sp.]MDN5380262.1 anthranilate synthase component [Thermodesulfobacterium sp.]HCP09929.1 aminodeoxychorismate/anthranilate synthase component II [Thermodesulfoba
MKRIIVIDNYDSFTYNLVQLIGIMLEKLWGGEIKVFRNDAISAEEVLKLKPDYLVISPGPCTPKEAGISVELIKKAAGKVPILGVCLGHQSIGYAFGAKIVKAKRLMHGKVSQIYHDGKGVFTGLPNPFQAMRYHSLAIDPGTLPEYFEVTARAEDGEIMGIRHKEYPIEGVQFHPESIGTSLERWMKYSLPPKDWDFSKEDLPEGVILLRNFFTVY